MTKDFYNVYKTLGTSIIYSPMSSALYLYSCDIDLKNMAEKQIYITAGLEPGFGPYRKIMYRIGLHTIFGLRTNAGVPNAGVDTQPNLTYFRLIFSFCLMPNSCGVLICTFIS